MFENKRSFNLALVLVAAASAAARAQAPVDPVGTWRASSTMGTEYRDMGTLIANIQTVNAIPYFGTLDNNQRVARFSDYGQAVSQRDFKAFAANAKQDFGSSIAKNLGTVFMTTILQKVASGEDMNKAVSDTFKGMTSKDFLAGNLAGGTLGAALGSLVPMPVLPGMAGEMMGNLPLMAGAMLGTDVALNLIHGKRAFTGIDPIDFAGQALGSTVGMVLGGMLPVPTLGPIVGGAIGGTMGVKLAEMLKASCHKALLGTGSLANHHAPAASPLPVAAAVPRAPSAELELAQLAPAKLKALSDGAYHEYLRAAAAGEPLAAATSLASYKQAQQALAAQR